MTPKEYGILQAFPMDDWKQVVSDSQAYKQFGNAVTTTVFTARDSKKHLCSRRKRGTKHGSRKQELYRNE